MSRITALLSAATHKVATHQVATHQLGAASVYPRNLAATAIPAAHPASGAVLVGLLLAVGCLVLVARLNSVLVNLVSQLVQIAAAVGRMLTLLLAVAVIASVLLLHI